MLANIITLSRLFSTFVVLALIGRHRKLDVYLFATLGLIFILDAVDGTIARKRNETTQLGEILDSLADRIIENTFWIYFTAKGHLPIWVPIVVMARGFTTDALQKVFGYPKSGWTHALTRSRMSRALYGSVKMLTFICLASATVFNNAILSTTSHILAMLAVGFCLLRGLPFFFIRKTSCPPST